MEINNSGDAVYRVMVMSYNIATDPDDLLRKISANVMRDIESVMRRIDVLLPSIYMGLEKALEKAPPGSFEQAIYRDELNAVKKVLEFLDDPGNSYLIGVPFQLAAIEDRNIYVSPMATFISPIAVLGFAKCTIMIFPAAVVLPDNMLRSSLVHELVHCAVGDPYERVTYRVREMLRDLVPDLFDTTLLPADIMVTIIDYIRRSRVPVMHYKTAEIVGERIEIDPEYARQIFRKSVIVRLKPSASWKKKS